MVRSMTYQASVCKALFLDDRGVLGHAKKLWIIYMFPESKLNDVSEFIWVVKTVRSYIVS